MESVYAVDAVQNCISRDGPRLRSATAVATATTKAMLRLHGLRVTLIATSHCRVTASCSQHSQLTPPTAPALPAPSATQAGQADAELRAECSWYGLPFPEPEGDEVAQPSSKRGKAARKRRLDNLRDKLGRAAKKLNSTRDAQSALRRAAAALPQPPCHDAVDPEEEALCAAGEVVERVLRVVDVLVHDECGAARV